MSGIKLSLSDEAKQLVSRVEVSAKEFDKRIDKAVKAVAEGCAEGVQRAILDQTFHVVPLSVGWVARKRRQNLDPRVLIATREYVDSIKAEKIENGHWALTAVQPKADYVEAKRPHRGPILDELSKSASGMFSREVMKLFSGEK